MAWAFHELHWSPADFWSATPHELFAALDFTAGTFKIEDFERFAQSVEKTQS